MEFLIFIFIPLEKILLFLWVSLRGDIELVILQLENFLPIYFEFYKENWFWNCTLLKKIDEYQLYFDWLKKNNSSWGYWKILDLYFSLQYKSVSFFVDKLDFYFEKNKWKLK